MWQTTYVNRCIWDFPGGTVVENLPADAGDTVSIPGPGRFHTPPQGNEAGAPRLLSPCAWSPRPATGATARRSPHRQLESSLRSAHVHSNKGTAQPKQTHKNFKIGVSVWASMCKNIWGDATNSVISGDVNWTVGGRLCTSFTHFCIRFPRVLSLIHFKN